MTAIVATFAVFAFTGQNELFTQQGRQSAQLGQLIESTTALQSAIAAVGERFSLVAERFDKVDARFDRVDALIGSVDRKIELSSTSVRRLIENARIPIVEGVEFVSIGDQIVALPETQEARIRLMGKNLQEVDITPSVQGFIADAASAVIVRRIIDDHAATSGFESAPFRPPSTAE